MLERPTVPPPHLLIRRGLDSQLYYSVLFGDWPGEPMLNLVEVIPLHESDAHRSLDEIRVMHNLGQLRKRGEP